MSKKPCTDEEESGQHIKKIKYIRAKCEKAQQRKHLKIKSRLERKPHHYSRGMGNVKTT